MDINLYWKRSEVEQGEKWREWCDKIPNLKFDKDWEVRIIPPFAGALARFIVFKGNKRVSVYFDGFSKLRFVINENNEPIPYYETYPSPDSDDVKRYYINETEEMLNDIRKVLND